MSGGKISNDNWHPRIDKVKTRNRWRQAHALGHLIFSPLKIEIIQLVLIVFMKCGSATTGAAIKGGNTK
jgi:hypothetical protein